MTRKCNDTLPSSGETVVARLPGGRDYRVDRAEDGTVRLLSRPITTTDSAPPMREVRRQLARGLSK